MRTNEMGNQTTSGVVLEEEKPVTEVPEEGTFEAGGEDKEMKGGENGVIPEDQTETIPNSNNVSDVAEKVQESEESKPVASEESANQEEEHNEKANSEFDLQSPIQEQYSIKRENDEEPDESKSSNFVAESVVQDSNPDESNSSNFVAELIVQDWNPDESNSSNFVAESIVQDSNPDDDLASESEEPEHLWLLESAEPKKQGESSHMITEDKIVDLVPEESVLEQDKPSESNASSEIPEQEQKQFVQAEEMKQLAPDELENGENLSDSEQANKAIFGDNESISSKQEEHNDIDIPEEKEPLIIGGSEHHTTFEDAEDQVNLNEENLIINNEPNETSPILPRISTDSNPAVLHLRKSPSFEFGIPLDARSEESDQTPLLVRDKSLARSISGKEFRATMIPPDYNFVEEKTIRMERSTSDIPRDSSFINFLKKDADTDTPPELQEMTLTSVKGRGKQKARASFFSACICCSAAIH